MHSFSTFSSDCPFFLLKKLFLGFVGDKNWTGRVLFSSFSGWKLASESWGSYIRTFEVSLLEWSSCTTALQQYKRLDSPNGARAFQNLIYLNEV
ncbi:hypothetical protein NC652_000133 [Populus alba x Populus x berolinensis]|nr:hypothetical protein NC652_000133 [Populus alba x Populus x berolinensis]